MTGLQQSTPLFHKKRYITNKMEFEEYVKVAGVCAAWPSFIVSVNME